MIQRIQSVYLMLTTILAGLFLTGNFFQVNSGDSSRFVMNIRGIYEASSGDEFLLTVNVIPVMVISLLIPLLSLVTIFLYRNRKIQINTVIILITLDLLLIIIAAYYIFAFAGLEDGRIVPVFRMFIPAMNILLAVLAFRGIRKDEKLVRSYDRLR